MSLNDNSKVSIVDFDQIIVTGDAFRSTFNAHRRLTLTQRGNVEWLHEMLRAPLRKVTGLEPKLDHVFRGASASLLIDTIGSRLADQEPSELWARGFNSHDFLSASFGDFLQHYDRSLVVGFEMSPAFRRILQSRSIGYIDFEVHPIRFMTDLMFSASSNIEGLMARFNAIAIPDDCIQLQASLMRARHRKMGSWHSASALLFTAQVARDRSIIRDGRMVGLADYADEFLAETRRHELTIAKPHPLQTFDPTTRQILGQVPNLRLYDANLYDLLASGRIGKLITLSSSSGFEAPYFDVEPHRLMRGNWAVPSALGIDLFNSPTWEWILGSKPSAPQPATHFAADGSIRESRNRIDKSSLRLSAGDR